MCWIGIDLFAADEGKNSFRIARISFSKAFHLIMRRSLPSCLSIVEM